MVIGGWDGVNLNSKIDQSHVSLIIIFKYVMLFHNNTYQGHARIHMDYDSLAS